MVTDEELRDTEPPASGPNAIDELAGLLGVAGELVNSLKKPDATKRPAVLFVRWKLVEGGIDITACTTVELEKPCAENEYQSRYT